MPARNRGLCNASYKMAHRMVQARETTWKELEERGVVLKSRQGQHQWSMASKRREYLEGTKK